MCIDKDNTDLDFGTTIAIFVEIEYCQQQFFGSNSHK